MEKESRTHYGVVLDVSPGGFDSGSASFGSIFIDEDEPHSIFLFYSGATNGQMRNSAIGLARSKDGLEFRKESKEPILEGTQNSFCSSQAITPIVTKIRNKFYMVLSGKPSLASPRRIGVAYADDPKGPWRIIGELIKPEEFWEGNGIDNGPSLIKIDAETITLYYSCIMLPKTYDVFSFLRHYPIRRIGILKVRIHGTSLSSIEAMRFSGNPLKHLNGSKGSWNESVFCPGYIKLNDTHYLFPAASTYSVGFPYNQYIGMVDSDSPYFSKETSHIRKLIDGPSEKTEIIPNIKNEIALDTPTPYLNVEQRKLFLYYSVAERVHTRNETWKIALTTFETKN